jgi:nitrate reductase gamma subunit
MFDLEFVRGTLHDATLAFMAVVYVIRVYLLTRFKAGRERQAPTGRGDTNPRKGILYSWANIGMPWAMESTRTKWFLYIQFVIFHLGVAAAISLLFSVSFYFHADPIPPALVLVFRIVIGAAFLVGVLRIIRRFTNIYVRTISSPDDHFSLWLLTVWFAFGFLAAPNDLSRGEWPTYLFFLLGAFFLVYVPFSKISHYLYYPFTRYFLGKTLGYRGVFPIRRGLAPKR